MSTNANTPTALPTYGGQAVIEGVMMRGASSLAIAMRAPSGEIVLHTEKLGGIYKTRIARLPFLRGLVVLWDALGLGMRALTISANIQTGEDEKLEGPALYLTLGTSLLLAIGLFFLLPATLAHWLDSGANYLSGSLPEGGILPAVSAISLSPWFTNLIEGLLRLGILIGYISLVGRMEEIKRVFGYHGAEHKTINAFEAGEELTPENVARHSLEHPRCGTAFLLTLVLASIVLFTLLGPMPLVWRLVSRVLLIPVLASLAYEYIRWTAAHLDNPIVQWMIKPNLALQHLTTREPSLDMLEVSISAFQQMRQDEQIQPL